MRGSGVFATILMVGAVSASAQQPAAVPSARTQAPVDLTGEWVSVVTEDWRWRMVTPPKGDYASVPLTAEARKVADAWNPARDAASGDACRAYGAAAVMRLPGRIRIAWEGDAVLRVETEAGSQTRLFRFGAAAAEASPAPTWQGRSLAQWQPAGGRRGAPPTGGSLRVVTTGMRAGYLRRNGVPYSSSAIVTEYYNRANEPGGDSWLIVTTVVDDPRYLTGRFVTSSHFKRVGAGGAWTPTPCETG